jgi:hypothetical protein
MFQAIKFKGDGEDGIINRKDRVPDKRGAEIIRYQCKTKLIKSGVCTEKVY